MMQVDSDEGSAQCFIPSHQTVVCRYNQGRWQKLSYNEDKINILVSQEIQQLSFEVLHSNKSASFQLEINHYHLEGNIQKIADDTCMIEYKIKECDSFIKELQILRQVAQECMEINHHHFHKAIEDINKIMVQELGVMCSSLWVYYSSKGYLECLDVYSEANCHFYNRADTIPYNPNDPYFQKIEQKQEFVYDALKDNFESEFLDAHIKRYHIRYKYDIPVFYKHRLVAILSLESTDANDGFSKFLHHFAHILINNIELIFAIKFKDENEEKLQAIINNEHTGIIIYRDKVLYANKAISNMNGYTLEEMQQLYTWEFFAPEIRPVFEDLIKRRMAGEQLPKVYNDAKIITKNGEIRTVRISAETIVYEGGYAGISTITDITDLVKTKEKLHILAQAVEQVDEMIKIVDLNGVIMYANHATTKLTGYLQYELFGAKANIVKSGKHPKSFYKELWDTILSKKIYKNIIINKKKDGTLYYEDLTITPVLDEKGEIKYFVATGKDVSKEIESRKKLEQLATKDTLTQIFNRYKMNEAINFEIVRAKRYKESFALIMFDIDFFKQINDTYGHDVGDEVLIMLSSLIQKNLRQSDIFARWGGEEFLILATKINKNEAQDLARKLLLLVRKHHFVYDIHVTISIGVVMYNGETKEELLKKVDLALYQAKNEGRDRIVFK